MKCKHYDGTGTTNFCVNGTFVDCPYCGGTGEIEVEMTNKEWLYTSPIEEMADEIISHIAHEIGLARYYNDDDVKEFVEWLKEKHDGNT